MSLYRKLSIEEVKEFKQWSRDNYIPFTKINSAWHPIIKEECEKINEENLNKKRS